MGEIFVWGENRVFDCYDLIVRLFNFFVSGFWFEVIIDDWLLNGGFGCVGNGNFVFFLVNVFVVDGEFISIEEVEFGDSWLIVDVYVDFF